MESHRNFYKTFKIEIRISKNYEVYTIGHQVFAQYKRILSTNIVSAKSHMYTYFVAIKSFMCVHKHHTEVLEMISKCNLFYDWNRDYK